MKYLYFLVLTLIFGVPAMADTAYHCDFQRGFPADVGTYDLDGLEPSTDIKDYGFDGPSSWNLYQLPDSHELVAISSSYFRKSGAANDWMVVPEFVVPDGGATLSWRAKAGDTSFRDGYSVYVSTQGGTPEDFTNEAILKVETENHDWTFRSLALDQYAGQSIWVAFVNDSKNKHVLFLDDIHIGEPHRIVAKPLDSEAIDHEGACELSMQVSSLDGDLIGDFEITVLSADGSSLSQNFSSDDVVTEIAMPMPFEAYFNSPCNYTVNLKDTQGGLYAVTRALTAMERSVLVEEVTGTWCGWCTRGIAMLRELEDVCPSACIAAYHLNDVMSIDGDWPGPLSSSAPAVTLNRNVDLIFDPQYVVTRTQDEMAGMLRGGIALQAQLSDDKKQIYAEGTAVISQPLASAGVCFIIVEDDVYHPENRSYAQSNSYSGGESGPMGGFEDMDNPIPATEMHHPHVIRAQHGDKLGVSGLLCDVEPHCAVDFEYTMPVPDNADNPEGLTLIALLVGPDGIALASTQHHLSGIDAVNSAIKDVDDLPVIWYNLQGVRVDSTRYRGILIRQQGSTTTKIFRQ